MMQTTGLLGRMSWESSAIYYKLIKEDARDRFDGLHSAKILLWSAEFHDVAAQQAADDWRALLQLVIDGARESGGAKLLLICTNTMQKLAHEVAISIPIDPAVANHPSLQ